jgi:type I restriction enzyme M protein
VERPLKLRFEITEDTLAALTEAKPSPRHEQREALVNALKPLVGLSWGTRNGAKAALHAAFAEAGLPWPSSASTESGIWAAIAISDPDGEVQVEKGEVVPDPDLRDYENLKLDEDADEYFGREILPYVPDAWIDRNKAKVGYEIAFTRRFYTYKPPRELAEIDAELRELESQIQALLDRVMS